MNQIKTRTPNNPKPSTETPTNQSPSKLKNAANVSLPIPDKIVNEQQTDQRRHKALMAEAKT
jgi:hypothetical protein